MPTAFPIKIINRNRSIMPSEACSFKGSISDLLSFLIIEIDLLNDSHPISRFLTRVPLRKNPVTVVLTMVPYLRVPVMNKLESPLS